MRVRAAWGSRGLYLRYESMLSELPPGARLDFHIARDAAADLHTAPAHRDRFLAAQYALPLSGRQLSVAMADAGRADGPVRLNTPSPWHMHFGEFTIAQLGERGILVRQVRLADGRVAVECFLPWSEAGKPDPAANTPRAGTRLAVVLGYDDDASGYRWPAGRDPWAVPGEGAVRTGRRLAEPVFGDIELAPRVP